MNRKSLPARRARGDAIEDRLQGEGAAIAKLARPFLATHKAFVKAADAVDAAEAARDAALAAVATADAVLDDDVRELANGCVTAGIGTRMKPFAGLTKYAPSELIELGYANEVKAVRALTAAIKAKKPRGALAKLVARVEKDAKAVEAALKKVSLPQKRYAAAIAARDALLLDWDKSLQALRRKVAAELDSDDAATALLAPAADVQVPQAKRPARKRKAKVADADE